MRIGNKILLAVLAVIMAMMPASSENVFKGRISALVYSTEHFDIIYSEQSAPTAMKIASSCEDAYERIEADLGVDLDLSIPVVVTPAQSSLNAYYSPMPYPRIVVYDTVAYNDQLACLENGIEDVFFHELAHAVSLNIRTPFWQSVSDFAGAWINPARLLYINQSFVEGLAVAFESRSGGGRLNDPYSMQILTQGKIEGASLGWLDISGERDIKPAGNLPYLWGGAFADYLIETYGMEKYAGLARNAGKIEFGLIGRKFRKVYSMSIEDAFSAFIDSIPVPSDVREIGSPVYSSRSINGITESGGRLFVADSGTQSLSAIDIASLKRAGRSGFSSEEMNVCFSSDGMLRAQSFLDEGTVFTRVERTDGKFSESTAFQGLRRPCIIGDDNHYFIAGVENDGALETVSIYEFSSVKLVRSLDVPSGMNVMEICDIGTSKAAILVTDGKTWRVFEYSVPDDELWELQIPEGIQIRSMRVSGSSICISCYGPDSLLSGYGRIDLNDGGASLRVSGLAVSGGVGCPVLSDGKVFFIGRFFEEDKVMVADESELELGEPVMIAVLSSDGLDADRPDASEFVAASEEYRMSSFLGRGSLLPYSPYGVSMLGPVWYWRDPTESRSFSAGAGYDIAFSVLGISASFNDSSLYPVSFDSGLQAGYSFKSRKADISADAKVSWTAVLSRTIGLDLDLSDTLSVKYRNDALLFQNSIEASLHSFKRSGKSSFEIRGFKLDAKFIWLNQGAANAVDVYLSALAGIPHLIPAENPSRWVFNLPMTLEAGFDVRASQMTYEASAVVFGYEIQKAVPWLSTYFSRAYVIASGQYSYNIKAKSSGVLAEVMAHLEFAPVLGVDIQHLGTGVKAGYRYSTEKGSQFVIGFESDFFDAEVE